MANRRKTYLVFIATVLLVVPHSFTGQQPYPFRSVDSIFAELRMRLITGEKLETTMLVKMGFVEKEKGVYELSTPSGELHVVFTAAVTSLAWNPKDPPLISPAVLSSLIERGLSIDPVAPEKLIISLPQAKSVVPTEQELTIGLDGRLYTTKVDVLRP